MSDRLPGSSSSNPIEYRGYEIYLNPYWASFHDQWVYVHEDYDGAPDAYDYRYGYGVSSDACKKEIDEALEEEDSD